MRRTKNLPQLRQVFSDIFTSFEKRGTKQQCIGSAEILIVTRRNHRQQNEIFFARVDDAVRRALGTDVHHPRP